MEEVTRAGVGRARRAAPRRRSCCPTLPPPFTRQQFTEDLITEAHAGSRARPCVRSGATLRKARRVRPAERAGHDPLPRHGRRRRMGRRRVRPGLGPALRQRQRDGVARQAGRAEDARRQARRRARRSTSSYCAACHSADLTGSPPEFPSLVGIGARRSVDESRRSCARAAAACRRSRRCTRAARRAIVRLRRRAATSDDRRAPTSPRPSTCSYSLDGNARFTDPDGFPAITPPWGTLTAIDMNKAAIAWQVPLGEMPGLGAARTPAARTTAGPW